MSPSFDTVGWLAATAGVFRKVGPVLLGGAALRRRSSACSSLTIASPRPMRRGRSPQRGVGGDGRPAAEAAACANRTGRPRSLARCGADHPGFGNLAVYGRFVEEKKAALRAGRRRAHAGGFEDHEGRGRCGAGRAQESRAKKIRAQVPPGAVVALPSAPCIAPRIDTPAAELDSYRTRRHAAHVHRRPRRPAAGVDPGRPQSAAARSDFSFIGWAGGDEALLDLAVTLSKYCGLNGFSGACPARGAAR